MWLELIFLIIVCIFYFYIYVDLKVNKSNEVYLFNNELTRSNINKEINLKLPFYFNGKHINTKIDKEILKLKESKKNKYEIYDKSYEKIDLLEPYIRCKTSNNVMYIYKNKSLPLNQENNSINYYIIKSGVCKIYFIHPQFKEHFYIYKNNKKILSNEKCKIDFIKKSNDFLSITFHKNTILYIPNHWILYIENVGEDKCIIEQIHFSTLFNQIISLSKKVFNKSIK